MEQMTTEAGERFTPEADARAHAQIGALLRRVWAESPPPAWTQERADQIFASVMATLERKASRVMKGAVRRFELRGRRDGAGEKEPDQNTGEAAMFRSHGRWHSTHLDPSDPR